PGQSSALTVASGTSRLCLDANYLPRQRVGHSSQSNSRHRRGKSHSKTRHLKFCRPEKSAGIQVHIHRRALDSDPLVAREKRTHGSPALKKASRLEHSGHSVLQLPSLNHWQYQTLRLTWKVLHTPNAARNLRSKGLSCPRGIACRHLLRRRNRLGFHQTKHNVTKASMESRDQCLDRFCHHPCRDNARTHLPSSSQQGLNSAIAQNLRPSTPQRSFASQSDK